MTMKTKVRKIGNSYGIILPKEALQVMKVKEGSVLYLTESPENALHVAPGDEQFERSMEIAERGMDRYRNALRELAK
jgi:putative addiction module antidote